MKTMFGIEIEKASRTIQSCLGGLFTPSRMGLAAGLMAVASCGSHCSADDLQLQGPESIGVPSYISAVSQDTASQDTADAVDPDQSLRGAIESLSEGEQSELTADPIEQVERRSIFPDRQTSFADGRFSLPPIRALTTETVNIGNGEVPLGFRQGDQAPPVELPESGLQRDQPWNWTAYHWAAPNTFSHPLYFEDRMLERHGHQRFPMFQPLVSGGRFAAQAFMLPYLAAIDPPAQCQYTLGYHRAGSCIHPYVQRPPYQRKAAASQATAIVSGIAILP